MADKWEWVALSQPRPARCDDPTTLGRVIAIVAEIVEKDPSTIRADSTFAEVIGGDSGADVEIIIEIEKQFETRIPDEAAEVMRTIQDMVDYLGANPKRFLLRPADPPGEGIVLLRPASGDDATLLRPSDGAGEQR